MAVELPQAAQPLDYTGHFSEDVYREKTPGRRRVFTLNGDRLIIQSRQPLGSESEIPVSLRGLDPAYAVVRHRSPIASFGALILGGFFAVLIVPATFSQYSQMNWIGISIDACLSLLCIATGLWNIRRIEYYVFSGQSGRFDIARSGPDRVRFDAFVARIVDHIHGLQSTAIAQPMTSDPQADYNAAPSGPATSIDPYSTP